MPQLHHIIALPNFYTSKGNSELNLQASNIGCVYIYKTIGGHQREANPEVKRIKSQQRWAMSAPHLKLTHKINKLEAYML